MFNFYPMSDSKRWALTLSAPCYPGMDSSMELVAGLRQTSANRCRVYAQMMSTFGSVGPKFVREGNRVIRQEVDSRILHDSIAAKYEDLRIQLVTTPEEKIDYVVGFTDPRKQQQVSFVFGTCYLLPPAGILAWNIARAIYYDRCSLLLGKEDPHTAMLHIMEMAKGAQRLYSSWEEYFTAFAVGEQFAAEDPEPEMSPQRAEELAGLMTSRKSAARYFPWDLKL